MNFALAFILFVAVLSRSDAASMTCGNNVNTCGVLTLESGMGPGVYSHQEPSVHGLWPEVNPYGNSNCVAPSDTTNPAQIFPCYANHQLKFVSNRTIGARAGMAPLDFETHEWNAHGVCAGVRNAVDFFTQICDLASIPLGVMAKAGSDFNMMQNALTDAGFEIFNVDSQNLQFELSACLNPKTGKWILTPVSNFPNVCHN